MLPARISAASRTAANVTPVCFSIASGVRPATAPVTSGLAAGSPPAFRIASATIAWTTSACASFLHSRKTSANADGAVRLGPDVDEASPVPEGALHDQVHDEVLVVEVRVDQQDGLCVGQVRVGGRGHHVGREGARG